MQCFARWEKDDLSGVYFRDQTILQFGDNWNLKANFILLNPGSALPRNFNDKTDFLTQKNMPFFVPPKTSEKYLEFSLDRLMSDILKLFLANFSGGTIRLYNLFNLKNQHSSEAIEQLHLIEKHPKMFSLDSDVKYCNAPVIIASGGNAKNSNILENQLIRYIKLANPDDIFAILKHGQNEFTIKKAKPDAFGYIDSYHPSYTFKYGNTTQIGAIKT